MKLKAPAHIRTREPDLTSLINIVFLILIFFIVAGALRPFSARNIELTKIAADAAGAVAPGRLIAHADGRLTYRGADIALAELGPAVASEAARRSFETFVIVADARLPGSSLLAVIRKLRAARITPISVMSERERK